MKQTEILSIDILGVAIMQGDDARVQAWLRQAEARAQQMNPQDCVGLFGMAVRYCRIDTMQMMKAFSDRHGQCFNIHEPADIHGCATQEDCDDALRRKPNSLFSAVDSASDTTYAIARDKPAIAKMRQLIEWGVDPYVTCADGQDNKRVRSLYEYNRQSMDATGIQEFLLEIGVASLERRPDRNYIIRYCYPSRWHSSIRAGFGRIPVIEDYYDITERAIWQPIAGALAEPAPDMSALITPDTLLRLFSIHKLKEVCHPFLWHGHEPALLSLYEQSPPHIRDMMRPALAVLTSYTARSQISAPVAEWEAMAPELRER